MIPVAEELDLRKAARCAGEKSIEMIKTKDLLPLTGYVHGGCSPIGMKNSSQPLCIKAQRDILCSCSARARSVIRWSCRLLHCKRQSGSRFVT